MRGVLALGLVAVLVLIICGSYATYALVVGATALLIAKAFTRNFATNAYAVSASVTLFILINLYTVLHAYVLAHTLGSGFALTTPRQPACEARGVQSWEQVVAEPEACAREPFAARRLAGNFSLVPVPADVGFPVEDRTGLRVQTCARLGLRCWLPRVAFSPTETLVPPWEAVASMRFAHATHVYLVHHPHATLTPSHDLHVARGTGSSAHQIWLTSRLLGPLALDAAGYVRDGVPRPNPHEVLVAVPQSASGPVPTVRVDLRHRCPAKTASCKKGAQAVHLPARELHQLAHSAQLVPWSLVALFWAEAEVEAQRAVVVFAGNLLILLLLALATHHTCLRWTQKSSKRIALATLAGASFHWVGLAASMVVTSRVRLAASTKLAWLALCVVHAVAALACLLQPPGGFALVLFLLVPSALFHGNVLLVNVVVNLVVSLGVAAVAAGIDYA